MHMDVFMRELSYEEITQQVAYDLTNLWSKYSPSYTVTHKPLLGQ